MFIRSYLLVIYNFLADGLKSESDDETSSLEKGNAMLSGTDSWFVLYISFFVNLVYGFINVFDDIWTDVSPGSLSDEEYVIVDNVEVSPNSETERAGAVQMVCRLVSHNRAYVFIIYMFSLLTILVFGFSDGTLRRCDWRVWIRRIR